ncbi:MAG: T9SS type B sorting domain-containing protein [Chitinophagaceae bacterium]
MMNKLMISLLFCATLLSALPVFSQTQACPSNINYATGDLGFWSARTGLVNGPTQSYPAPNTGVPALPEFNLSQAGIRVITSAGTDQFGGFTTIPTINGYAYNFSVLLGSSATSFDLHSTTANPGGFTRALSYVIDVPPGPITTPYTMTYAYAMVLENGTHNSNEQPLFKATLSTVDSIITCASPQYFLPTFNNATPGTGSTGATLDTATAIANGFTNSPVLFLSHAGTQGGGGTLLQDVWTKGWTEVTFDLSPYRGQQVTLTFEADNCAPGAHFAYAYVALRNNCAGLEISGNLEACQNNTMIYSVPALAGAAYHWTVPAGWTINSGSDGNILNVTVGANSGQITANEINGCANLKDTIQVHVSPPTVAGLVLNDNTVCSGLNSTLLNVTGNTGNVLNWLSSPDGVSWSPIGNTTTSFTAQNLTSTTYFSALVQNGSACNIDTSAAALIKVDPKSVGGVLSPLNTNICAGENSTAVITLTGNIGSVVNWQSSLDNTNWSNFFPVKRDSVLTTNSVTITTDYRTIVKSGVCPADTSATARITFINVPFPKATIDPALATICYGKSIPLNANITIGTSYTWNHPNTLINQGNGTITSLPFAIHATAIPATTTDYVLSILNAGCPNPLRDTFHIIVKPRLIVFAGNDTSVVVNQPLQLNALVNQPAANIFTWTPATGLSATNISNPIATFGSSFGNSITYIVRAEDPAGCYAEDNITITVFKTGPEIFVPSAFTPNGDGRNDVIYPICVGIKELKFFRIFNRWGQLVFTTSQFNKGWDGAIGGSPQGSNNFVYMAQGIDYLGNTIFKKGNIVLIR